MNLATCKKCTRMMVSQLASTICPQCVEKKKCQECNVIKSEAVFKIGSDTCKKCKATKKTNKEIGTLIRKKRQQLEYIMELAKINNNFSGIKKI